MKPGVQAFHAVAGVFRALAHQLRTPLAVVSNDLFYFQTLLPENECERSQQRCRQISELVQSVCEPFASPLSLEKVLLTPLLRKVFSREIDSSINLTEDVFVLGDQQRLEFAFTELRNLRLQYPEPEESIRIKLEPEGTKYVLSIQGQRCLSPQVRYNSLGEFFYDGLGIDLISPGIIDLIFAAHGFAVAAHDTLIEVSMEAISD